MFGLSSIKIVRGASTALVLGLVAPTFAESAEASFRRLASELPFVSYGSFLYDRRPRDYSEGKQVTKAWDALEVAMKAKPSFAELAALATHEAPKVRTLGLLGLFDLEDPKVFRIIHAHIDDTAATFAAQSEPGGRVLGEKFVYTQPATVGTVARRMLQMVGFPADWQRNTRREQTFEEWSAMRLENPDWIGWYDFLYARSAHGIRPAQPESQSRIAELRKKMEARPLPVRAWMWFGLADDDMMIPRTDTALATEAEIIEAGRQLGPNALLAFLRDGTRAGLRHPKADDPQRGRRFVLSHGKQLFGKQDADALFKMGHFITAADAKPAMASEWLRAGLKAWNASYQNWERAKAVAALFDLRGDAETDFVVKWFYETPNASTGSTDQSVFIHEVERRKPKEWQKTARALVAHPGFEQLSPRDVSYIALLVNKLGGEEVVGKNHTNERADAQVRNKLREHFGIVPLMKQRLEAPPSLAEQSLWSTTIEHRAETMAVSPDGKIVAIGQARGNVLLFDGASGRALGELPVEGDDTLVHFRKPDGRLLTFTDKKMVVEWDAAEGRLLAEKSFASQPLDEPALSDVGDILASRAANERGITVVDLKTGELRWNATMRIRAFGLIALSPDGRRLAVGDGFSKAILLWDTASGKRVATLHGHAGIPNRACFSPDGTWLISTGEDTKVLLWDGRTGESRREYLGSVARFSGLAFTSDSKRFIACTEHGRFAVFNCETGTAQVGYKVPGNRVAEMEVSEDGTRLFMLVIDGGRTRIDCWNLPAEK